MSMKKKYKALILGAGTYECESFCHTENTRVDINPDGNPDVVWDLNNRPLPFDDSEFHIIYAFEILEHIGKQGDFIGFFEEFNEYWRILEPLGSMVITVPTKENSFFLSEPGHTRVIKPVTFGFLNQEFYNKQVGKNRVSDYRHFWKKNFNIVKYQKTDDKQSWHIVLQKT